MPTLPRFDLQGLRRDAQRFAHALPSIAARLGQPVPDPITERLTEGIAYLGATVLGKIGEFQVRAHEALAERACPWNRRPIPAATIVAIDPPGEGRLVLTRDTVFVSAPVEGTICSFRPVTELAVAPYDVTDAALEERPGRAPIVRIGIDGVGRAPVNDTLAGGCSLYFGGDLENALRLVHALTHDVERIEIDSHDWETPLALDPLCVQRGGLDAREALAPDPDGLPAPFGSVTEAFLFPDKFRFLRVGDLQKLAEMRPTSRVTFSFALRQLLPNGTTLSTHDVRAHCVVVSNLFEGAAEPLPLSLERKAVPLRVAGLSRTAGGVYAVRGARAAPRSGEGETVSLPDVRRLKAARADVRLGVAYSTSPTGSAEDPEVALAFGPCGDVAPPPAGTYAVSMRVLATNRHIAARIRAGDLTGELALEGGATVRYRNVVAASAYIPPPVGDVLALLGTRHAAVRDGLRDPLTALKRALFLSVPFWAQSAEETRAQNLRIEAFHKLDVTAGRRLLPSGATRSGYIYRATVDEAAFRGPGDMALFGASLGEALSRSLPVNAFVELTMVRARTGTTTVFPRRRSA